jgi:hypothetical protein
MTEPADPHHHFSHRQLLKPDTAAPGRLDAIVVPTNRPISYLRESMRLARELDCLLLVLCSTWSNAGLVISEAARAEVPTIAVDVPPRVRLPRPTADDVLLDTPFRSRSDTSMKRNIGLAVARMMDGWQAILFLDDDITVTADDVRGAAGLLADYDAVGLANTGFPDNSVVCHANREVSGQQFQDTFIGAGALLVPAGGRSHFPHVYNEDWFFLFEHIRERRVALTGEAAQRVYDPFDKPARARRQEFGDCLAEGVFELLDDGRDLADAGLDFWRDYLGRREAFIAAVMQRLPTIEVEDERRARMTESLRAAQNSRAEITPELCVRYLEAWQHDRKVWGDFLADLPEFDSVRSALRHLKLVLP